MMCGVGTMRVRCLDDVIMRARCLGDVWGGNHESEVPK